ncbi:hypothetical protein ACCS78_14625 [Rhizobium johnstonii]
MKALGQASTVDEKAAEAAIRAVPGWANADMRYALGIAGVASPTHRAVDSQNWFVAEVLRPTAGIQRRVTVDEHLGAAARNLDEEAALFACDPDPPVRIADTAVHRTVVEFASRPRLNLTQQGFDLRFRLVCRFSQSFFHGLISQSVRSMNSKRGL